MFLIAENAILSIQNGLSYQPDIVVYHLVLIKQSGETFTIRLLADRGNLVPLTLDMLHSVGLRKPINYCFPV